MPVNSTHPDYDAALSAWLRARDVLAGEDAIKAGGEKYLPRLDSQSAGEFADYVKRASFFNATARTAEAYLGLIFRRQPFVKLPEGGRALSPKAPGPAGSANPPYRSGLARALAGFVNDVDMLGTTLTGYAKMVVGDVVGIGRCGSLVDWCPSGLPPSGRPPSATGHRAEERVYAAFYRAEQIVPLAGGQKDGFLAKSKTRLGSGHRACAWSRRGFCRGRQLTQSGNSDFFILGNLWSRLVTFGHLGRRQRAPAIGVYPRQAVFR